MVVHPRSFRRNNRADGGDDLFHIIVSRLRIHDDRYHDVVGKLLKKALEVQYLGSKPESDRFIEAYTGWDENLHGVIAKNIRDRQRYRFRIFTYAALGE